MSLDNELNDKKEYELSFLLTEEAAVSDVDAALSGAGAEVSLRSPANSIRLAYPVKKHESAHFGYRHFSAYPAEIKPLKEKLEINPRVLRLLVLTPPVKQIARENKYQKSSARPSVEAAPVKPETPVAAPEVLSNEGLEKKLEEILK